MGSKDQCPKCDGSGVLPGTLNDVMQGDLCPACAPNAIKRREDWRNIANGRDAAPDANPTDPPCPFCAGTPVVDKCLRAGLEEDDPDAYSYVLRCLSCAAQGPWGKSESSARGQWRRLRTDREQAARDERERWAKVFENRAATMRKRAENAGSDANHWMRAIAVRLEDVAAALRANDEKVGE